LYAYVSGMNPALGSSSSVNTAPDGITRNGVQEKLQQRSVSQRPLRDRAIILTVVQGWQCDWNVNNKVDMIRPEQIPYKPRSHLQKLRARTKTPHVGNLFLDNWNKCIM
jgi:hypothetical protein